ncbi:MAG: sugar ABC transporter ATP-binding protein [Ruminiclostridium sp.]
MGDYALEMRGIEKAFPGVKVLKNIDFNCFKGEVHALIGENGAGKSTLMKILAGAYKPDSGNITIEGKQVNINNPQEAIKLGIAVIYQELNLIPYLSAIDNVLLGHEKRNKLGFINIKKHKAEAQKWLNDLGEDIIEDYNTPVCNLSIAQQQMVEIAKALSLNANIIVMDEPSATLTEKEMKSLFAIINKLRDKGKTIIYISHRLEELFTISDRVTVLRDGELIKCVETSSIDKAQLICMMIGRELDKTFPPRECCINDECALEVKSLSGGKLLRDISFKLMKGEILGISGLVGSGRSELVRAVFGADPIMSGEIFVKGKKVSIKSPDAAVKLGLGLATEDRKSQGLFLDLSIRENTTISSLDKISSFGFIDLSEELKSALKYIDELNIKTSGHAKKVGDLSGGNQQKVVLAKWLSTGSEILILDEPTRGIDVGAKYEIYCLMNELVKRGIGIIMISSEMPEIIGMSDRILVMHEGKIAGEINSQEVTEEKIMWYATGNSGESHFSCPI